MRLFQNSGIYPSYRQRLDKLAENTTNFQDRINIFLNDRFGASHFLKPILDHDPSAFFANADDDVAQRQWAEEAGLPKKISAEGILLSQIEAHRTEVFYNSDPMRYGSTFVRRLPGSVRCSIAWRAAPSPGADFSAYDLVVCNFPGILDEYRKAGWKAAWFAPAYDPVMTSYAENTDRPVDVLFIGGYSRHHRRRAEILETVASRCKHLNIVFHLDQSRLNLLAESIIGNFLPLRRHRRPDDIRELSAPAVFGLDLYAAISSAKIVLNGAVDMAGEDRGNMRCFEAMGCGALMVSDAGHYPQGMINGETMLTYSNSQDAVAVVDAALADPKRLSDLASRGHRAIADVYSKARQWQAFQQLVEAI